MATAGKTPATAAAAILVLLFCAALIAPASASTITVFKGPGCAGKTKDVNSVCGCYSINGYPGGYHFVFTEDVEATLYTGLNCQGASYHLTGEKRFCSSHKFKSIDMLC